MEEGIAIGGARGFRKGEASGFAKGAVTGEAKLLIGFLELRFGPLTEPQRARIEHASLSEIEEWADRLLTAPSLAGLLGEPS